MTRADKNTKTKDAKTKGSWFSLATASLLFIAVAALMGWAGSFIGLHGFGMQRMTGFTQITAWAIPGAYDGAALACTFAVYRASINGRSAARGRVMMFAFTGVSSWVNWTHQIDHTARLVAAGLPIAAVVVFDFLMAELRADWEAAHGRRAFRIRPALLILRYLVDRKGTKAAFRAQITAIPVSALAGLGADLAAAAAAGQDTTRDAGQDTTTRDAGQDTTTRDAGQDTTTRDAGQDTTTRDAGQDTTRNAGQDTTGPQAPAVPHQRGETSAGVVSRLGSDGDSGTYLDMSTTIALVDAALDAAEPPAWAELSKADAVRRFDEVLPGYSPRDTAAVLAIRGVTVDAAYIRKIRRERPQTGGTVVPLSARRGA